MEGGEEEGKQHLLNAYYVSSAAMGFIIPILQVGK